MYRIQRECNIIHVTLVKMELRVDQYKVIMKDGKVKYELYRLQWTDAAYAVGAVMS